MVIAKQGKNNTPKLAAANGSGKKALWIALTLVALTGLALLTFYGLTEKTFAYGLPRRLKKIWAIVVVSFAIGYSSTAFQTITNNRILTPSVMGLDSLYMLIQTVIVFFFGSGQLAMMSAVSHFLLSVGIMVGLSFLLYFFLFRGEKQDTYFMVLVGMIFGSLFGGLATFMQMLIDPNEFSVLQGQMFASFNAINQNLLLISTVLVGLCLAITYPKMSDLDVLSLGKTQAINLGVDYTKTVQLYMCIIAVMVSVATALVGPVTFLGILVVSLGRQVMKGFSHKGLVAASTLLGVIALGFGQFFVEHILKYQTTVGVMTNFVGGLYFFYKLLKERKVA